MLVNGLLVKKEDSAFICLAEKVTGESGNPGKDFESGVGFEHEKRNSLLHKQANNNRRPVDRIAVVAHGPEERLEDEKTEDGDGAITIR